LEVVAMTYPGWRPRWLSRTRHDSARLCEPLWFCGTKRTTKEATADGNSYSSRGGEWQEVESQRNQADEGKKEGSAWGLAEQLLL